jgi:hypothetical protein
MKFEKSNAHKAVSNENNSSMLSSGCILHYLHLFPVKGKGKGEIIPVTARGGP